MEVVREVWAMQLDATRNRIIRIDLIVAIASFALILPTVPAAFFVSLYILLPIIYHQCADQESLKTSSDRISEGGLCSNGP